MFENILRKRSIKISKINFVIYRRIQCVSICSIVRAQIQKYMFYTKKMYASIKKTNSIGLSKSIYKLKIINEKFVTPSNIILKKIHSRKIVLNLHNVVWYYKLYKCFRLNIIQFRLKPVYTLAD